jgi:hypothetical protein
MQSKENETFQKAKAALLARRLTFAKTLAAGKARETDKASAQRGLAEIYLALQAVKGLTTSAPKPKDLASLSPISILSEGRPKVS